MKSILEDYNLSNRLVSSYGRDLLKEIDENVVNTKMKQISDISINWLNKQLEK